MKRGQNTAVLQITDGCGQECCFIPGTTASWYNGSETAQKLFRLFRFLKFDMNSSTFLRKKAYLHIFIHSVTMFFFPFAQIHGTRLLNVNLSTPAHLRLPTLPPSIFFFPSLTIFLFCCTLPCIPF